jgi:hypothetical protein
MKDDNISLDIHSQFRVENDDESEKGQAQFFIIYENPSYPYTTTTLKYSFTPELEPRTYYDMDISYTISYSALKSIPNGSTIKLTGKYGASLYSGDNYNVRIKCDNPTTNPYSFTINQYPSQGTQPSIQIPSNIWVSSSYGSPAIYTTQSFMVDTYKTNLNTPTWYMKDIVNSGYDPILTEWGVQRGDVFRFEGDEKKTFMVDYVTTQSVDGNDSVMVHLNGPVPSNININHYSLIRYVDDASQIIIEGFRPNNTSAPYIIKPEFVVPELDKDIDAFIVDLTQKGLL